MVSAIARLPAGLHHGSAQSTRFSCEIKLINPEYYATACIFVDYGAIKSGQANLETLARGCVNRIATTTIKHPVASHYATPELWYLRNSNVRTEQHKLRVALGLLSWKFCFDREDNMVSFRGVLYTLRMEDRSRQTLEYLKQQTRTLRDSSWQPTNSKQFLQERRQWENNEKTRIPCFVTLRRVRDTDYSCNSIGRMIDDEWNWSRTNEIDESWLYLRQGLIYIQLFNFNERKF